MSDLYDTRYFLTLSNFRLIVDQSAYSDLKQFAVGHGLPQVSRGRLGLM